VSRLLFAVALALTACSGAPKPDPIAMAEAACKLEVDSVIRTGACDEFADVTDCPWFALAMVQCRALLDEAVRQVEK